jgi:photosystem II protein PsbQ
MSFFRPLISLLLVCIAVLVVSCSDGNVKAPTYSADQLAQIQQASQNIQKITSRLDELEGYIDRQDWNNVRSFIHGPLGELRSRMTGLSRDLLPAQKDQALKVSKEVFVHLNKIDAAAGDNNRLLAASNYSEALKDLDAFNGLLPALPNRDDSSNAAADSASADEDA